MAPNRRTDTAPPSGLTAEEAALLEELTAKQAAAAAGAPREVSPLERVVASGLRERDHLDGCPGSRAGGTPRVEAYVEVTPAPSRALQAAVPGVRPGDRILVLRCVECAGLAYKPVPDQRSASPVEDYVRNELARRAGTVDAAELDTSLA